MKTLHIAIQEDQLNLITEDSFDFDEILEVAVSMLRGVMTQAATTEELKAELYSRVNYKMTSLLTEFLPDEKCKELFALTQEN